MTRVITIMSIQSTVAYGHVGNSAAAFGLMRSGVEVWPVITVHFSNNTGYGEWRGPMLTATDVADVVRGIDDRGVLGRCDAVLSGYQGAPDMGAAILDAVRLVKARNPKAIYCCDPVLGDVDRGMYVRPGIPELMRDTVVPAAQVVTPNQFELEFLTGAPTTSVPEVVAAADLLRAQGPERVLVTSVLPADAPADTVSMVAVAPDGAWLVSTPLLPRTFTGAGDLTSAIFLARLLAGDDAGAAVARTASIVHGILTATIDADERELQLVAAQDEIVQPSTLFTATRLRRAPRQGASS